MEAMTKGNGEGPVPLQGVGGLHDNLALLALATWRWGSHVSHNDSSLTFCPQRGSHIPDSLSFALPSTDESPRFLPVS